VKDPIHREDCSRKRSHPNVIGYVGGLELLFALGAERLWVNPDCGLKTRQWSEVTPSLARMVNAAKSLRATLN